LQNGRLHIWICSSTPNQSGRPIRSPNRLTCRIRYHRSNGRPLAGGPFCKTRIRNKLMPGQRSDSGLAKPEDQRALSRHQAGCIDTYWRCFVGVFTRQSYPPRRLHQATVPVAHRRGVRSRATSFRSHHDKPQAQMSVPCRSVPTRSLSGNHFEKTNQHLKLIPMSMLEAAASSIFWC